MANHISHAALPYPIKGCRFTIEVPYLDADGDPTDPTTPDTERSIDAAAFADCTEEVSTITGSNGFGYITLTGDEMNGSLILIAAKVASGPKNTLASLHPRVLPVLRSGTAQAGAAGTITLDSSAVAIDDYYNGCIIRTTGGTGGAGGSGSQNNQARVITDYVGSTKVATISPNWETNPDNTTTFEILFTPDAWLRFSNLVQVNGTIQTAGDLASITTGIKTKTDQLTFTTANKVDAAFNAAGDFPQACADKIWSSATRTLTSFGTLIQDIWDKATSALTTAGSIGKLLVDNIDATISSRLASASYTAPPSAAANADAVWDEARSGHVGAGSFGEGVIVNSNSDKTGYALTAAYDAAKTAAQAGDAMALTSSERNSTSDAILDRSNGVETSWTLRQALRVFLAALGGKCDGGATTTMHFRNQADNKNRITATVDADGNRTAVSFDLT